MIRWGLGLLMALTVAFVAAIVIVSSALSYGWQRAWVIEQVELAATDALGRPVSIKSLEGVLHREFQLGGIEIGDAGARLTAPLVSIEELEVELGSVGIRGIRSLTLESLRVSGLALQAVQAEDGRWSWEVGAAPEIQEGEDEGAPSFLLRIRSLTFRNAHADIQPDGQSPFIVGLDADAEGVEFGANSQVEQIIASFEAASEGIAESARIGGRVAGSFLDGEWRVAEMKAASEGFSVSARGAGDAQTILEAQVGVEIASLGVLAKTLGRPDLALAGSLGLNADFSGTYAWPLGTLSMEGDGLKAGENEFGELRVKLNTPTPGRLEVDALSLNHPRIGLVSGSGAVITLAGDLVKVEHLNLRRRSGPGALRVAATLPLPNAEKAVSALYDPRTRMDLVSAEFRLETLQPLLRLWGVSAQGQLDSELQVRGARSGPRMTGFLELASSEVALDATRLEGLDLRIDLSGTFETPVASVKGSASRFAAAEREWGAVSIAGELDKSEARIDRFHLLDGPFALRVRPGSRVAWPLAQGESGVQLRFLDFVVEEGNQTFALRGAISRDRADALSLEVRAAEPARIFERLHAMGFIPEEQALGGVLNGDLLISGTRAQPDLRANFEWSEPQIDEFSFDAIRAKVDTEESFVRVSADWIRRAKSVAQVQASLPREQVLAGPEALSRNPQSTLQAQLDQFELGSLAPFLPPSISSMRGKLSVSLDAKGAPSRPQLAGSLTLSEGGLKLSALGGQAFAPIAIQAALRDGAIEVEKLQIGEGEQRVDGQATIQLTGASLSDLDSELVFRSFPVDAPGLVKGTLSGPLRLAGKPEALDLTGSLEIGGLLVRIPDPGDATLKEIRIVSSDTDAAPEFREEGEAESLLDPLRVSVDVRLAKNSWARGRGAEIELRGDLNARKERGDALRLSGAVNTVRGTYEVYGRRFRIERGEVVLDGAIEADPVLDVRALHRVRGVKIYAIIEGRLSEPRLRFESDPELDETDIASYLLLGRPASGSAGEDQLALEAVAAQVAVGAAIREFERMFGGALPVDLIDIRMDNEGDERALRAGVGKYIGDRLFLHYERGFGDEPDDELKAEWEITPIWSLESTVSSNGDTAGDVVFEIEY